MSRAKQLQIENLKQDLTKLEKDYVAVAEKKRWESNPQEQGNLQLQLDNISRQIDEIELQLRNIKQQAQEDNIQSLLRILTTSKEDILKAIQKAYRACSPEDWQYSKLENIDENIEQTTLANLLKMPKGDSQHTRVESFVACLLTDNTLPLSVVKQLLQWGEQNINNFQQLFNKEKQNQEERCTNTNSYLLILLQGSQQKLNTYTV
ncbi:MAG: hypothetical protein SAK29_17910, partial [Scytonema sp. PMC 1069.18]|nr:hypothetical protein [Scytonema sp. PMC 1069.18]